MVKNINKALELENSKSNNERIEKSGPRTNENEVINQIRTEDSLENECPNTITESAEINYQVVNEDPSNNTSIEIEDVGANMTIGNEHTINELVEKMTDHGGYHIDGGNEEQRTSSLKENLNNENNSTSTEKLSLLKENLNNEKNGIGKTRFDNEGTSKVNGSTMQWDTNHNKEILEVEGKTCFYHIQGRCMFGERCKFSHRITKQKQEQRRCLDYQAGKCKYGERCQFSHVERQKVGQDKNNGKTNMNKERNIGTINRERKLCLYYERTGRCKYGAICKFVHSERQRGGRDSSQGKQNVEERKMAYHEENKKPCYNYERDGRCRYGDRCKFSHGKENVKDKGKKIICKLYEKGNCRNNECPFAHINNSSKNGEGTQMKEMAIHLQSAISEAINKIMNQRTVQ